MIKTSKIQIFFTLQHSAKKIFDFVIRPENMSLYSGFLLIPGIKNVISSDQIRKSGTVDKITNTDGSSHLSKTDILISNSRYSLILSDIKVPGLKGKLANPIEGFSEDWIFNDNGDGTTSIDRTLFINYKAGFFNDLFIACFVRPQLYFSFLRHHKNLQNALS